MGPGAGAGMPPHTQVVRPQGTDILALKNTVHGPFTQLVRRLS